HHLHPPERHAPGPRRRRRPRSRSRTPSCHAVRSPAIIVLSLTFAPAQSSRQGGRPVPSRILDYPIFDADNHMYETPDALTKHLEDPYKEVIKYIDISGRTKIT